MASKGIPVVFGTASFGSSEEYTTPEQLANVFSILKKHNVKILDSAQLYGPSEVTLGSVKAGDKFTIDTKWLGGWQKGISTKQYMIDSAKESIKKLGVEQVDIFYIHAPDYGVPFEETLSGVNEVYKSGAFKRFGLSNFSPDDVQKTYDVCKANNYVLPTVYQGNYSPVARKAETLLFPIFRKLGISFYAYSPLAGGFLTKTKQQIADGAGRFNAEAIGGMYKDMYTKPSYLEALAKWEKIANDVGCSRADLAYRWVTYNSPLKPEHGDAIIVGASRPAQLDQTLTGLEKGPLPQGAIKAIDEIWEEIKADAPLDNFSR